MDCNWKDSEDLIYKKDVIIEVVITRNPPQLIYEAKILRDIKDINDQHIVIQYGKFIKGSSSVKAIQWAINQAEWDAFVLNSSNLTPEQVRRGYGE